MDTNILNLEFKMFYRSWVVENAKSVLVISHGLGEHSGRYDHFARFLNENNISVYACDHYGHGKSDGVRGHIDQFDNYANDLIKFIEHVIETEKIETVNILGHSLGGIIVHDLLTKWTDGIHKVVISNPGYKKKIPPTPIKVLLGNLVGKLFPKLSFDNELDVNGLSTDKNIITQYVNDPLVHSRVTAKWFLTFTDKIEELKTKTLANVINPILFISSYSDPLTDQNFTEEIYEKLESPNTSMIHYEDMKHELLNEVEKEKVYKDVLEFIQ